MKDISEERKDMMGVFHNKVVTLIDESQLSPAEINAVLGIIMRTVDKWFEITAKNQNTPQVVKEP